VRGSKKNAPKATRKKLALFPTHCDVGDERLSYAAEFYLLGTALNECGVKSLSAKKKLKALSNNQDYDVALVVL